MKTLLLTILVSLNVLAKNSISLEAEYTKELSPRIGLHHVIEIQNFDIQVGVTSSFKPKDAGTRLELNTIARVNQHVGLISGVNLNVTSEFGLGYQLGLKYDQVFIKHVNSNSGFKAGTESFDSTNVGIEFEF